MFINENVYFGSYQFLMLLDLTLNKIIITYTFLPM